MTSKLDFLGNELNIGDEVVFCEPSYRNLIRGSIVRVTDKLVIVEYAKSPMRSQLTYKARPRDLVKVTGKLS